jgi:hypothetical protein
LSFRTAWDLTNIIQQQGRIGQKKTYSYDFCKNAFVENEKKVTEISNLQHNKVTPQV